MTNDEPLNNFHTTSKKENDYIVEYNLPYNSNYYHYH